MKERYDELTNRAWDMPSNLQRLTLLEEAIQLADRYLTKQDAYEARMTYTDAAIEAGFQERMLVSFSWCLAEFEKHPGEYPHNGIMWHYKWVLHQIWRFPRLSREQIEAVFEDFRVKCEAYGYKLGPYYKNLYRFAEASGEVAQAAEYYKKWKEARRDGLSDCSACEQHAFGEYHMHRGHYKRGLRTLKPILEGKMVCRSIPKATYSEVLIPLLENGDAEEAARLGKKGYRLLNGGQGDMDCYGDYLEYYTITDMNRAVKIFEQSAPYVLKTRVDRDRFLYLVSALLFMEQWHTRKRRKKLAVPDQMTLEWVRQETARLADLFDQRNGNDGSKRYIAEKLERSARLIRSQA
ncbi:hypothetical protein ACFO9Q_00160 [Paenibacillus sp. GCM10023252]|uniref:hypothetical protein n=1 Tax=Paenibacillus sp. GCM10023252 TaxID=3252649 RepID=UPI00360CA960